MPWSAKDAKGKKKSLSPAQATTWAKIANSVLKQTGDEGKAIRIANAKAKTNTKKRGSKKK